MGDIDRLVGTNTQQFMTTEHLGYDRSKVRANVGVITTWESDMKSAGTWIKIIGTLGCYYFFKILYS